MRRWIENRRDSIHTIRFKVMGFDIGMLGMKHHDGVGMRVVANILSFHHKGSVGRNIRHTEMGLTVLGRNSCLVGWLVARH